MGYSKRKFIYSALIFVLVIGLSWLVQDQLTALWATSKQAQTNKDKTAQTNESRKTNKNTKKTGSKTKNQGRTPTVKQLDFASFSKLQKYYSKNGFSIKRGQIDTYVIVKSFPHDFHEIRRVSVKKKLFKRIVLPIAYLENERIRSRSKKLRNIKQQFKKNKLTKSQRSKVLTWLKDYNVVDNPKKVTLKKEHFKTLSRRIGPVPPSMVVAQSAIESGWGTSRFARKANNIFGERVYNTTEGLRPTGIEGKINFRIRVYDNLRQSIRGYMHNLNSGWAYQKFRKRRNKHGISKSLKLVKTLKNYSEREQEYVDDVKYLIKSNNYHKYD